MNEKYDKRILFSSGDGPDGITLYTSEDRAVVDFARDVPALYLEAAVNGTLIHMGPFMQKIRLDLEDALQIQPEEKTNG